jgi:hypothetical protein
VAAGYLYSKNICKIQWKNGFFLSTTLFIVAVFYFVIRVPERNYNLVLFAPLVYGLIMQAGLALNKEHGLENGRKWILYPIHTLIFVVLLSTTSGFFRSAALFPFFVRYGLSYTDARNAMAKIIEKKRHVYFSKEFFSLMENYEGASFPNTDELPDENTTNAKENIKIIVMQQVYRGFLKPPVIPGYELTKDCFSRIIPKILGVRISSTVRAYNFAVYRKIDTTEDENWLKTINCFGKSK